MTDTRKKTQTKLHNAAEGIEGNCTQAAIATLMGLELDAVPDFNTIHQHAEHSGFYWNHVETWFRERGWEFVMQPGNRVYDGMYLADGPSERGVGHFVVMKDGALYHDPHPSRAGIIEIKHVWILVPLDPSVFYVS